VLFFLNLNNVSRDISVDLVYIRSETDINTGINTGIKEQSSLV